MYKRFQALSSIYMYIFVFKGSLGMRLVWHASYKDSLIPSPQPRTEKLKPSRTRGDHGGTADLLMFLQLCCSIVEQHLLELLLLLQVKLSQLSREVVTHHLKIVLCISTVFAGLRRRGSRNNIS